MALSVEKMMIIMSDAMLLVFDYLLYFIILKFKRDNILYKILAGFSCIMLLALYFILTITNILSPAYALFFCLSVPSYLVFLIFSKYKKFRFLFVVCQSDVEAIIIGFISRCISMALPFNEYAVNMIATAALCILVLVFGYPYFKKLRRMLDCVDSDWLGISISTIITYILLVFLAVYPNSLEKRPQYMPHYFLLCIAILQTYYITLRSIMKSYTINAQNEELKNQNKLYELAYHDPLTGIGNRAAFGSISVKIDNRDFQADSVSCIMMDINNLKLINDRYGHKEGDLAILCLRDALKLAFGDWGNNIFRLGGDEFCVICFNIEPDQIEKKINQIRDYVKRHRLHEEMGVSIGYSEWDIENDVSFDKAVVRADALMYEDKRLTKQRDKEA